MGEIIPRKGLNSMGTSHINSLFVRLWEKKEMICSHGMSVNLLFSSLLSETIKPIQVVYPHCTIFPGGTGITFPDLLGQYY